MIERKEGLTCQPLSPNPDIRWRVLRLCPFLIPGTKVLECTGDGTAGDDGDRKDREVVVVKIQLCD